MISFLDFTNFQMSDRKSYNTTGSKKEYCIYLNMDDIWYKDAFAIHASIEHSFSGTLSEVTENIIMIPG